MHTSIKDWIQNLIRANQSFIHQTTSSFINKEEKFKFIMFGMKTFRKFKFQQMFFFENLFKCYKWKHDLEVYSIMY